MNQRESQLSHRKQLEKDDHQYLWHPFTQMQTWLQEQPLIIERAEGSYLIDTDGRRYIDGVSSLWVNVHGHQRKELNQALTEQLQKVAHSTFLGLTHPAGIELAKKLVYLAPVGLTRVFFSDTGATAVEIALKMAFQYWQQGAVQRPRKTKFLYLQNGYHGDTVGAMSVGGIENFHEKYRPLLFPTVKAPSAYCYRCYLGKTYPSCAIACLNDVERALIEHADELAAVIMEPVIQGAAGMIAFPPQYTRSIWELAKRNEVLFIADEVATGFGRTGKMFACEQEGITPDLMTVGKGLTGGYLPLAATFATEDIFRAFLGIVEDGRTLYHGHTYTGNPLACAVALANLQIFENEQTLRQLETKIHFLQEGLAHFWDLKHVGDVRQAGFIVGIELVKDKTTKEPYQAGELIGHHVIMDARKRGVIIRPLSDIIVLMPPLSISPDELKALLDAVYDSIKAITEL
jgi:adenosylmethionine-8-amino-7-oxononanoate aminotransferase